ncbi:MAG: hypothetical protein QM737_02840 [Ferruginibacter sp.]
MEETYKLLDTFHHPKYNIETYVLKRNKDIGFHQVVDKEGNAIATYRFHDIISMNENFNTALYRNLGREVRNLVREGLGMRHIKYTTEIMFEGKPCEVIGWYDNYFHQHGY